MGNITKGSITSQFPDDHPEFTVQSEVRDPSEEDSTLAEGRDANKWSAEVRAITEAIGTGGRGQVSVSGGVGTIESLKYVYRGKQKTYVGTISLALQTSQVNYIYLNPRTNTAGVSTSAWPTIPHFRLAIWDDSGVSEVLTDSRPHDLKPAAFYPIEGISGGQTITKGAVTVANGETTASITWGVEYASPPVVTHGVRLAGDATLRYANFSDVTVAGATVTISSSAPADGCQIDWQAIGILAIGSN